MENREWALLTFILESRFSCYTMMCFCVVSKNASVTVKWALFLLTSFSTYLASAVTRPNLPANAAEFILSLVNSLIYFFLAGWKQLHCLYLTDQTSDRCIAAQKSQHWKDLLVCFQTWLYCTEKHHGGQWLLTELRLPSAVRCQQKQLL